MFLPYLLAEFYDERIGVYLMQRRCPEACDFSGDNYFTFEDLLITVDGTLTLNLLPVKLFLVEFVNGGPVKAVVQVEAIHVELLDDFKDFIQKQIPRLLLPVIEGSSIVITD